MEIASATLDIFRLIRAVPQRVFGGDPVKLANFAGLEAAVAAHLLLQPDGLDCAIGRGDFIDSDAGFKCVEVNPYGNLGGLETEFISQAYRQGKAFSRFVTETGVEVRSDRLVLALFEHFVREVIRLGIARDEINIAAIVDDPDVHFEANTSKYGPIYAETLNRVDPSLRGRIVCCPVQEIGNRHGALFHRDARIHGAWELVIAARCPERFYLPFKNRPVAYFNSPLAFLLGDKRVLSLLSQLEDDPRFTLEEQQAIRRHLPWSRNVEDAETRYRGQRAPLLDIARRHHSSLVLKKGFGMKGEQVVLGPAVSVNEWEAALRTALSEGDWLVQEYVEPRTYLYQHGALGAVPFRGIWGTFCFGQHYAGAYLRVSPEHWRGPINSAQGAMTCLVFEAP